MTASEEQYLALSVKLLDELVRPRLLLLTHADLGLELLHPLLLDVLAHRAQGLPKVLLVALHDDLELADRLRLLVQQLVLLALRCVWGQLRPCRKRGFEREDLRRLRLELPPCREQLLLELSRSDPSTHA